MENVMTKGFCELNENEIMETEGGKITWGFYPYEVYKANQSNKAANAAASNFVKMVDEAVMLGQNVPIASIALAESYR
jgi:hypothetical protein